jgi:hypothetical protein
MFQSALSTISSTILGAAKNTINEYRPSNALKADSAFERLAQQGIVNISYRSPVMATLAETMLQNVRLEVARKERVNEYIKADNSKDFRGAVEAKLGTKSGRDIEQEMSRILNKISRAIDTSSEEEVKKSTIFKEYGKYFDEFKNAQQKQDIPPSDTPNNHSVGDELEHSSILHKIESNTQRTYNALEELVAHMGTGSGMGGGGGKSGLSFIDPMTGMPSMSAAIGSIGGSFLTKVFDDETIGRFAKKTKSMFGFDTDNDLSPSVDPVTPKNPVDELVKKPSETTPTVNTIPKYTKNPGANPDAITESLSGVDLKLPTPKKSGMAKTVSDILGDLSLDLNSGPNDTKINTSVNGSVSDHTPSVAIESLAELKKISANTQAKIKPEKVNPREQPTTKVLKDKKAKVLGKAVEKTSNIKNAAVAESVAASSGGILSGLANGAKSLVSGAAALAAAPAVVAAAPWALGAAAVGAVGYGAYKMLSSDGKYEPVATNGMGATIDKYSDISAQPKQSPIIPQSPNLASQIENLSEKKDMRAAERSSQPIVISNSTATPTQQSAPQAPTVIVGTNVRNTESTFERVQMQDFWNRTA